MVTGEKSINKIPIAKKMDGKFVYLDLLIGIGVF